MIFRRFAFFFAMFSGLLTTQMPEYWQQYRQRLEGAIDELSAIVMQFEKDSAAQGMTVRKGIAHLEENSDALARSRGVAGDQFRFDGRDAGLSYLSTGSADHQ